MIRKEWNFLRRIPRWSIDPYSGFGLYKHTIEFYDRVAHPDDSSSARTQPPPPFIVQTRNEKRKTKNWQGDYCKAKINSKIMHIASKCDRISDVVAFFQSIMYSDSYHLHIGVICNLSRSTIVPWSHRHNILNRYIIKSSKLLQCLSVLSDSRAIRAWYYPILSFTQLADEYWQLDIWMIIIDYSDRELSTLR